MTQEINKAFHEAAGKQPDYVGNCIRCGHYCSEKYIDCTPPIPIYPDYAADPRLVIEVMREQLPPDKLADFLLYIIDRLFPSSSQAAVLYQFIDLIMDRTGKLAKLATEWINKQKGKSA